MKVFIKVITIIVIAILVTGGLTVAILFKTGKIKNINVGQSKKLVYEEVYDNPFDRINIKVEAADIEIRESDDGKSKLVIYDDYDRRKIDDSSDTLDINIKTKKCKFICLNRKAAKIILLLPATYSNEIVIDSNYGDINIGNLRDAVVNIEDNYGDIKIDSIFNATIEDNCGDIEIGNVSEYFDIETNLGDVKIDNANIIKNSKIETDLGDIEIGNTNEIYIDAKTSAGNVKINNNYRKSNITLKIKNSCGDIEVKN